MYVSQARRGYIERPAPSICLNRAAASAALSQGHRRSLSHDVFIYSAYSHPIIDPPLSDIHTHTRI